MLLSSSLASFLFKQWFLNHVSVVAPRIISVSQMVDWNISTTIMMDCSEITVSRQSPEAESWLWWCPDFPSSATMTDNCGNNCWFNYHHIQNIHGHDPLRMACNKLSDPFMFIVAQSSWLSSTFVYVWWLLLLWQSPLYFVFSSN